MKKPDATHGHEDETFTFLFGWLNDDNRRSKIALIFRSAVDFDLSFVQQIGVMIKKCDYSYFLCSEQEEKRCNIRKVFFGKQTFTQLGQNLIIEKS